MKKLFFSVVTVLVMVGAGSFAAAMDTKMFKDIQIHGFISQGFLYSDEYNYLAHNSTDGSFDYNEVGINFSKNMTDKLRIGVQFFSRDLGDASNNKVTIDWAYGDYHWKDWMGVRAGKIKLPMGFYNETRDVDMLRTSIVMPQGVYSDLLRDTSIALNGASIYGNVSMGGAGNIDYQLIVGSTPNDNDSGSGKYFDNAFMGMATSDGDMQFDTGYCGSFRWNTPLDGLRLGAYAFSTTSEQAVTMSETFGGGAGNMDSDVFIQVYSVEYSWNNLILAAEWWLQERDFTVTTALFEQDDTTDSESYYLSASYQFTDWFTLGAYYSETYPDKDEKDGDNMIAKGQPDHRAWEKDIAVTLRFDVNSYWVIKLEGHSVNGTANVVDADNPTRDEEDWYYGTAKVTFSF
ncbi:hypothetical protein DSCO28_16240 [Desulfosarcina ovata subsp. sediminis]|uniref:Porin domain-containing protein n=1 Tax=Desulfosarcina ovata subsp. sediminis TaxID=885957 RepID=A0A5K7ZFW1_9BACT|nr:hypothetical protein [Desulfosarcina ovata]BBO81058.1 hypothetical protein DSCO28_16240 [Desulfosarcina ovata subsp. sediminis]